MDSFLQILRNLGPAKIGTIAIVSLALMGFLIFVATRLSAPQYALLYGELDQADANEIIAQLSAQQVPFELRGDGSDIMVPADQVAGLRLTLAAQGLTGAVMGYEIFDRSETLGTSNLVQEVSKLRALEGELSRTITSLSIVKAARIHLVLPRRELFSRETQEPTASVVLKMKGSNRLDAQQINAVQQLVATAVPKLDPSRITIIDNHGTLLSAGGQKAGQANMAATEMRTSYEGRLRNNIEGMLERIIGIGKVRAEVRADMDFNEVVVNEEIYDPEGQVLRSSEAIEENSNAQDAAQDAVTVGNNLPDGPDTGGTANGATETQNRTEERTNFEISRTMRNTVTAAGKVNRLSIAVLVDGTYDVSAEGVRTYKPRTPEEMAQIEKLVKSAMGFDNADRGDTLEVANMQFADFEFRAGEEEISYFGLTPADIKWLAQIMIIGLLSILILLLVVRPLISKLLEASHHAQSEISGLDDAMMITDQSGQMQLAGAEGGLSAGGGVAAAMGGGGAMASDEEETDFDSMIDIANIDGRVKASSMKKIGEIIDAHPEEAVSILRNWIYQEAG